jgi:hypothetical protein
MWQIPYYSLQEEIKNTDLITVKTVISCTFPYYYYYYHHHHRYCYSSNIIGIIKSRRMRWVEHVAHIGEMRNAYKMLVGKPEGKRPVGRSRSRWENNNKMYIWERVFGGVDWIHLAQDSDLWWVLVNTVMNLWVP